MHGIKLVQAMRQNGERQHAIEEFDACAIISTTVTRSWMYDLEVFVIPRTSRLLLFLKVAELSGVPQDLTFAS
jgi:hypothetical protein